MREFARRYGFAALMAVFCLLASARLLWLYRMTGGVVGWDFGIYTAAVERAAGGADPYLLGDIGTGFVNHPGFLLLVYPFQRAGQAGSLIWFAGLLAAWPLTLRLAAGATRPDRLVLLLIPLAAAVEGLFMGQASLPAALCLAAAYAAARRDRDDLAGFLIGLGVMFKLSLAIYAVYFIVKKRARSIAALGATIAVFSLASEGLLYRGINGDFVETMAGLYANYHPGANNASLVGLPYAGLLAAVLLAALCLRLFRAPGGRDDRLEFGGLAALSLLISPLTWHHHFVLLAVPLAGLLDRRPRLGIVLVALIQVDMPGQLAGLPFHFGTLAAIGVLIISLAPLTSRPNTVILSNTVRSL